MCTYLYKLEGVEFKYFHGELLSLFPGNVNPGALLVQMHAQ